MHKVYTDSETVTAILKIELGVHAERLGEEVLPGSDGDTYFDLLSRAYGNIITGWDYIDQSRDLEVNVDLSLAFEEHDPECVPELKRISGMIANTITDMVTEIVAEDHLAA
jgi:hypothetical protein